MNVDLRKTIAATCAFGVLLALPAKADPPKKTKAEGAWPSPTLEDQNLDWKRLKVTIGVPHVQGGTVGQVQAALQKLNTPLSMCYSREVVHGHRFRGTADLTLWLNASGNVSNVRVAPPQGNGLSQGIVSCWSNAARALHFERPSAEGVTIAVEVHFFPEQGQPEPVKPKAQYWGPVIISSGGQTDASGAVIPNSSRVIAGWRATLKPCANLARGMADGGADGTLALVHLSVTVARDGTVSKASTLPANTVAQPQPDAPLAKAVACVVEHARALHFAPLADGEGQLRIGVTFRKP